jgi:amino acid permease
MKKRWPLSVIVILIALAISWGRNLMEATFHQWLVGGMVIVGVVAVLSLIQRSPDDTIRHVERGPDDTIGH